MHSCAFRRTKNSILDKIPNFTPYVDNKRMHIDQEFTLTMKISSQTVKIKWQRKETL